MCMYHGVTGNKQAFCLSSAAYHTTLAACALLASRHEGKPASVLLSRTRVRHITPHLLHAPYSRTPTCATRTRNSTNAGTHNHRPAHTRSTASRLMQCNARLCGIGCRAVGEEWQLRQRDGQVVLFPAARGSTERSHTAGVAAGKTGSRTYYARGHGPWVQCTAHSSQLFKGVPRRRSLGSHQGRWVLVCASIDAASCTYQLHILLLHHA